jgi:hypothetical protein
VRVVVRAEAFSAAFLRPHRRTVPLAGLTHVEAFALATQSYKFLQR